VKNFIRRVIKSAEYHRLLIYFFRDIVSDYNLEKITGKFKKGISIQASVQWGSKMLTFSTIISIPN
jgi:hypothetical protein